MTFPTSSLFLSDAWLDAACGAQGWQRRVDTGGKGIAVREKRFWGMRKLNMPPLTPCFRLGNAKAERSGKRSSFYHELDRETITLLSDWSADYLSLVLDLPPALILPLSRAGFDLRPKLTYRIVLGEDIDLLKNYNRNTRRAVIRKFSVPLVLTAVAPAIAEDLFASLLLAKEVGWHLSGATFQKLCDRFVPTGGLRVVGYQNPATAKYAAALMTVRDGDWVYALFNYRDPAVDIDGNALQRLYHEEMQRHRSQGAAVFDFNGSMLPGVEPFLRGFGGTRCVRYHAIRIEKRWMRWGMRLLKG